METSTNALTNEVIARLRTEGVSVVGISNVERFNGAPRGHHPRDFLRGAKSVVTFGIAMLYRSIRYEGLLINSELVPREHQKELLQNYFYKETGYKFINDLLDTITLRTATFLESHGYLSMFFPTTWGTWLPWIKERIPSTFGLFSQRHAAVLAGLGEFGLNNVVVTPQHGPRIRFNSVITEAELTPSPLLEEKVCQGESCSICVRACPGAISIRPDYDPDAVWYNTPARTDFGTCERAWDVHYCLGRCIKFCPVGLKSPKR